MPIWLLPLLLKIGGWIWHSVIRFWSVFLVGLIILSFGLWVRGYKAKIYNEGYKNGYSQCIKDHPTQQGNIFNIKNGDYKWLGIKLNIWKIRLGVGF
mgnify:CR=1 FL=1